MTYTCTVLRTAVVSWFALPDINGVDYFSRDQIGQRVVGDFQLALTNKTLDPNITEFADLTTTLTFTASTERNGTVVQCLGDEPGERRRLVLHISSK